jgi:hypothetical protein
LTFNLWYILDRDFRGHAWGYIEGKIMLIKEIREKISWCFFNHINITILSNVDECL